MLPLEDRAGGDTPPQVVASEPDSESSGVLNRGGAYAFVLSSDASEKELYVFGGEADGTSRELLADVCGARVTAAGIVWDTSMPPEKNAPSARAWGASASVLGARWPVGIMHGGRDEQGRLPDEARPAPLRSRRAFMKTVTVRLPPRAVSRE